MLFNIQKPGMVILLLLASPLWANSRSVAPESIPGAVMVSAEEVIELILTSPELVVIDSRKKNEYSKGHIESAVNLLNADMQPEMLAELVPDKSGAILFYCNGIHCLRSADAVSKALSWGYENIFWFRGGWQEWTEKRLPMISD